MRFNAVPAALLAALLAGAGCQKQAPRAGSSSSGLPGGGQIKTVFLILMENENWPDIDGNPDAPYLNGKLLPQASYATQYFNPPGIHPSLPNYLWLEAGDWFGKGLDDSDPSRGGDELPTRAHLATLLTASGRSWKEYAESIDGHGCPLASNGPYAAKHNPFVYFDDLTGNLDPHDPTCLAHNRPYPELASDLASGTVASYNFITPNQCNDMHSCPIAAGDRWLSHQIPVIMASRAYQTGGAILITWDEGENNRDGPIGLIVISPFGKGGGYHNAIHYDHSSTVKTVEEIFSLKPLVGHAADPGTNDLGDLFR
jgi:phosphatidylinositol-3-phosphatase